MLSLVKCAAMFEHVNLRVEKHGDDDDEGAADLSFTVAMANTMLDALAPGLRAALYQAQPGAMADLINPDDPPLQKLRFPLMGAFKWNTEVVGGRVLIGGAISDHVIRLDGCQVNRVRLSAIEGGSVTLAFRVQCHPEPEDVAALYQMQRQQVQITVVPPGDEPIGDEEGGSGDGLMALLDDDLQTGDADGVEDRGQDLAYDVLVAAGYTVLPDEFTTWTAAEVLTAVHYCAQLKTLGPDSETPVVPEVLRHYKRSALPPPREITAFPTFEPVGISPPTSAPGQGELAP